MTRYRYLDGMGDVVADGEFPDHPQPWIGCATTRNTTPR